ncbi:MAG: YceI family protein [Silicimonas sp.]|nr:YceI family protein [Silicimonas sp.]
MRRIFWIILTLFAATTATAAPLAYTLNKDDSRVGFSWFLGRDEIKGQMPVANADIVVDFNRIENSRVSVAVDVTQARAGFPFASQGMKSRKVLWADRFPQITFASTSIQRAGNGAKILGDLTVRGVTRPVVFDAQLFRQRGTEPGDRRRMSILLTGSLSRKAFGADGWADLAGDEVRLSILARIELDE